MGNGVRGVQNGKRNVGAGKYVQVEISVPVGCSRSRRWSVVTQWSWSLMWPAALICDATSECDSGELLLVLASDGDVYRVTTASVTDWRTAERIASCCNRAECRTFALPGHMVLRNSPSPSSAPVSIPNPNNCNSNPRHQSHKCNNHDNTF